MFFDPNRRKIRRYHDAGVVHLLLSCRIEAFDEGIIVAPAGEECDGTSGLCTLADRSPGKAVNDG